MAEVLKLKVCLPPGSEETEKIHPNVEKNL